jgi:hypothetical protein
MLRRTVVAAGVAVFAACALAGAAMALGDGARSATAHSGSTSATVTFKSGEPTVSASRLTISLAGQQLYNQAVKSRFCSPCQPFPLPGPGAQSPVRVLDLDSDRHPEVLLSLYTGGAHCCAIDQVFSEDPGTMTFAKTEKQFAAGVLVKRLGSGRRWRFVSADPVFQYQFTDYAHSGQPIQIWSFSGRRFHNVTRNYPNLIRSDAKRWFSAFRGNLDNGVGLIAAWAADEDMLGHSKQVASSLKAYAAKGALRSDGSGLASGQKFVRELQKFLRQHGYTR